jgi:hypothetical protein
MSRLFGPNSTGGGAVGGPEIKLHLRSHADRPDPFQLLDGYGQQHFLFLPVDVRARALARMQARHVRPCAIADQDKSTGPADRRYGKGQTFTVEIAAASSSVSSALDRAIEQSLVRRRACHGRRTRMRIDPDAFTLGGSRTAALFHDNAGDPVYPTDGYQGFEITNCFTNASRYWCAHRHRWLAHTTPRLCSFVRVAWISSLHPVSLVSKHKMTTSPPFFFINTPNFLFALRFAIGTCMLQLDFCK